MKRRPPRGEPLRQTEFYRPFDTGEMSDDAAEREISANDAERAALAQRFGLQALDRLSATLTVRRVRDDMFHVSGRLSAAVVQQCVVTLEPVRAALDEPVTMTFVKSKAAAKKGKGAAEAVEGLEDEGPEIMAGDLIDLGEAVAQQLAVSLDPYPRAPGASLEAVLPRELAAEKGEEKRPSPFAVLEALRKTKPS
ncbi:MAG: YceD family protein [Alphaproteobacteria bacterium]